MLLLPESCRAITTGNFLFAYAVPVVSGVKYSTVLFAPDVCCCHVCEKFLVPDSKVALAKQVEANLVESPVSLVESSAIPVESLGQVAADHASEAEPLVAFASSHTMAHLQPIPASEL